MFQRLRLVLCIAVTAMFAFGCKTPGKQVTDKPKRIVNIVNFIRLLEPLDSAITQDVLYQTVVAQVKLFSSYHLPATYLL
jgi:hypothetical protein